MNADADDRDRPPTGGGRALPALFALTLGLSAFLLFAVQPLIARMLLPALGGSAAVWITCSLFFQAVLLLGYLYAHALATRIGPRAQLLIHLGLLAAAVAFLPPEVRPAAGDGPPAVGDPRLWLLGRLAGRIGLPLVALAATAPLLQRWFARSGHARSADPYPLYVASNLGSLLALGLYPFAIEPFLTLGEQAWAWRLGDLALVVLVAACAGVVAVRGRSVAPSPRVAPSIRPSAWWSWAALAFVPSSLLLGVTLHLTTDIASVPLLWIGPLGLYLLSFVVAFAARPAIEAETAARWFTRCLMLLVPVMMAGWPWAIWLPLHLLTFFLAALACHGELARRRPAASALTAFYLAIAAGGAAGGLFNALVAPSLFDRVVEYPLGLVLGCFALPGVWPAGGRLRALARAAVVPALIVLTLGPVAADAAGLADSAGGVVLVMLGSGLAVLIASRSRRAPLPFALGVGALLLVGGLASGVGGRVIHRERNFYGVITIRDDPEAGVRRFFHGSTLHGQQGLDPARRREPMTYFTAGGPVGQIVAAFEAGRAPRRVAVVGLGAGSLTSYARPDQSWDLYELDPAVVRIAADPRFFTFLTDCRAARLDLITGDARLRLADAADGMYGLIVLDAFSSDAPPVHLLTREAIALYRRKLAPGGLLAINLTNRYQDLGAVVAALADAEGLVLRVREDVERRDDDRVTGRLPSIWAVLAEDSSTLGPILGDARWHPGRAVAGLEPWTDESSDLIRPLISRLGRRPGK